MAPDPYAAGQWSAGVDPADPPPGPPVGVLPVLRLRRLGLSAGLVDGLAALWDHLDVDARAAAADDMAALGDRELVTRLVGAPPMGRGADAVVEWAEQHDHPGDAARHALLLGAGGPDAAARLDALAAR